MSGHGRIPGCPVSRSGLAAGTPPATGVPAGRRPRRRSLPNFGYPGLAPADKTYRGLDAPEATQTMFGKPHAPDGRDLPVCRRATSDHGRNDNPGIPPATPICAVRRHDIISNTSALDDLAAPRSGAPNRRRRPLHLDVLYGEARCSGLRSTRWPVGARATARLFAPARSTAPTSTDIPPGKTFHAFRDHPAVPAVGPQRRRHEGRPDALIPDLRNDDNAWSRRSRLSSITCTMPLWPICRKLGAEMPTFKREGPKGLILFPERPAASSPRSTGGSCATISCGGCLPTRCERPTNERLLAARGRAGSALPLEFTHAAFRLGHAMVRLGYKFNADSETQGIARCSSQHRPRPVRGSFRSAGSGWRTGRVSSTSGRSRRRKRAGASDRPTTRSCSKSAVSQRTRARSAQGPSKWHAGLLFSDLIRGTVGGLLSVPHSSTRCAGQGSTAACFRTPTA